MIPITRPFEEAAKHLAVAAQRHAYNNASVAEVELAILRWRQAHRDLIEMIVGTHE